MHAVIIVVAHSVLAVRLLVNQCNYEKLPAPDKRPLYPCATHRIHRKKVRMHPVGI